MLYTQYAEPPFVETNADSVSSQFAEMGSASPATATRQQKAVGNLTMILNAMGCRGRVKFMSKLLALNRSPGRYSRAETVSTLLAMLGQSLSAQHPQVLTWFDEYYRMWGVSYEELMDGHLRASWRKSAQLSPALLLGNSLAVDGPRAFSSMSGTSSDSIRSLFDAEKAMADPLDFADVTLGLAPAAAQPNGSMYTQEDGLEYLRHIPKSEPALSTSGRSQVSLDDDLVPMEVTFVGIESFGSYGDVTVDQAFGPLAPIRSGGSLLSRRVGHGALPAIITNGVESYRATYPDLGSYDSDSQPTSASPQAISGVRDMSVDSFRRAPAIIMSGVPPVIAPPAGSLTSRHRRMPSSPSSYNDHHLEDEDMGELNW